MPQRIIKDLARTQGSLCNLLLVTVLQDAYYSQNSKARPSLAMMEEKIEVAAFGRQVLQKVSVPRLILCDTHTGKLAISKIQFCEFVVTVPVV